MNLGIKVTGKKRHAEKVSEKKPGNTTFVKKSNDRMLLEISLGFGFRGFFP